MAIDQYTPRKTLSRENQGCIKCPLFGVETKLAACYALDYHVMRGEKPAVRQGCQVAMRAGKCAARAITKKIFRENTDPFYAEEHRVFTVPVDVINAIDPVLIPERMLNGFTLTDGERQIILAKNGRGKLGGSSTLELADVEGPKRRPAKKAAAPVEVDDSALIAAETGDLSAVLSAAARQEVAAEKERPAQKPAEPVLAKAATVAPKKVEMPSAAAPAPRPGMSLLELARAKREAQGRAA